MTISDIKIVNPQISNFKVIGGEKAFEEVVYSARMSGVPAEIQGEEVFRMMVANDYGSALEHVIIKFDIKMAKGNAPELLEHRMASHSGFSTRFINVNQGIEKEKPVYEIIMPWHLLKLDVQDPRKQEFLNSIQKSIASYESLLQNGIPRESARYNLPFCQAVGTYHVTINLRSLLNFLGLRLCVRSSPEMRCLASQMYFKLLEELPTIQELVGCRGFMKSACPEEGVTGVRKGEQHPVYPPCVFRSPNSDFFIPTASERVGNEKIFNLSRALEAQKQIFTKWAAWEG